MQIKFLGAIGTVTGSKYLLTTNQQRILLDCGLFRGYKALRPQSWDSLPIDPASIDTVVITHAHIDHTGYIPLLVNNGCKGPIYATAATYDLCSMLLRDSGHIQEKDAKHANKYGCSKHRSALPLHTKSDAEIALKQFKTVGFSKPCTITDNAIVTGYRTGHILGSAFVQFDIDGTRVLFTGDSGIQ